MNLTVITAPERDPLSRAPIVFLAGPIRGAADWQARAMAIFGEMSLVSSRLGDVLVANPRRAEFGNEEYQDSLFHEQVDWEHEQLGRAFRRGVILFWLAEESEHACDNPYAKTTRFELAEHAALGARIVVGGDPGFPGLRYIRYTLEKKYAANVKWCRSLEECCFEALRAIR